MKARILQAFILVIVFAAGVAFALAIKNDAPTSEQSQMSDFQP